MEKATHLDILKAFRVRLLLLFVYLFVFVFFFFFISPRLGLVWGRASVTVVAFTRFELHFVVASSRCRVGAFTCVLASERVIARCMFFGDDVTLPSFLLHHLSLGQPKFVLFVFGYQTVNIIIFCSTSQSTSRKSTFKFKVIFQQR